MNELKIKQSFDKYFDAPIEVWKSFTDLCKEVKFRKNEVIKPNGQIRDYFSKGTDFNLEKRKDLKQVQFELNERPRKVLEHETPLNAISRLYFKKNVL